MRGHVILDAWPRELDWELVSSKITELMSPHIALEECFLISSPDLVLAVRGQKNRGGGGDGRGGNEIWQNTIAWARIWPTRQLRMP